MTPAAPQAPERAPAKPAANPLIEILVSIVAPALILMKLSEASTRTAVAIQSDAITSTSERMFGRTWTKRMRAWPKPSARPASTNWRSFTISVGARAMRAKGASAVSAIATIRLAWLGPSSATMISPRISAGKDSRMSITCITSMSKRPPT